MREAPHSVVAGIPFDVVIYNFKRHFVARTCASCAHLRDTLADVSSEPFQEPEVDIDLGDDVIRALSASQENVAARTDDSAKPSKRSKPKAKRRKSKRRRKAKEEAFESEEHRLVMRLLREEAPADDDTDVEGSFPHPELLEFHSWTTPVSECFETESKTKQHNVSPHLTLYKQM